MTVSPGAAEAAAEALADAAAAGATPGATADLGEEDDEFGLNDVTPADISAANLVCGPALSFPPLSLFRLLF